MSYKIIIKKNALKYLLKVPKQEARKISGRIDQLAGNPYPEDSKKLKGSENDYRIRIGDYRVIYSLYKQILTIEVIRIRHRKDVYRK